MFKAITGSQGNAPRRTERAVSRAVMGMLCAVVLAACGSSSSSSAGSGAQGGKSGAATGSPITIALDGMKITGLDLLTGEQAGAQAAADQINANGGFGGHKVVIDTCNSMAAAAQTTDCAHKLVTGHPVAMIGCELNWALAGALQLFASQKIPSFNCVNTKPDYTNPWNFGLSDGGLGDVRGMARWLCAQSDVKTVGTIAADVPAEHQVVPMGESLLDKCGKKKSIVYFPPTASDYGPYVAKVLASHPDFVQIQAPAAASALSLIKNLKQAGFQMDHVGAASSGFEYSGWKAAGSTLNGVYMQLEFDNWNDTNNPDVAAYLKAMRAASQDPKSVNPEWGYNSVMWIYAAAKAIGFDKFDASTLTDFMRTKNGVDIPLSRKLVNPGPTGYPQVKQPYTQLVQWQNGKFKTVTSHTNQGWLYGY